MKTTATELSTVQEHAVDRAIRYLKSAKVKFAVMMPNGEVVGDLKVSPKTNGSKTRYKQLGYIKIIDGMKPGEVHSFETPEGLDANGYRASIASRASHSWGNGRSMTAVTGNRVELMRLED